MEEECIWQFYNVLQIHTRLTSQVILYLCSPISQISPNGFTICRAYNTLCPQSFKLEKEELHKHLTEKNGTAPEQEHLMRDPSLRMDRHALDVTFTEQNT